MVIEMKSLVKNPRAKMVIRKYLDFALIILVIILCRYCIVMYCLVECLLGISIYSYLSHMIFIIFETEIPRWTNLDGQINPATIICIKESPVIWTFMENSCYTAWSAMPSRHCKHSINLANYSRKQCGLCLVSLNRLLTFATVLFPSWIEKQISFFRQSVDCHSIL